MVTPMKLSKYLRRRGETGYAFALRSGVPRQTIGAILEGGGASAKTALAIIRSTDGRVRLQDLVPDKGARR
jgi:hypothetical protein